MCFSAWNKEKFTVYFAYLCILFMHIQSNIGVFVSFVFEVIFLSVCRIFSGCRFADSLENISLMKPSRQKSIRLSHRRTWHSACGGSIHIKYELPLGSNPKDWLSLAWSVFLVWREYQKGQSSVRLPFNSSYLVLFDGLFTKVDSVSFNNLQLSLHHGMHNSFKKPSNFSYCTEKVIFCSFA